MYCHFVLHKNEKEEHKSITIAARNAIIMDYVCVIIPSCMMMVYCCCVCVCVDAIKKKKSAK